LIDQLLDTVHDHLRLKGLDDHAVRADVACLLVVHGLERTCQKKQRNVLQPRNAAHVRRERIAVDFGQGRHRQHHVRQLGLEHLDRLAPVGDGSDTDVFVREGEFHHTLDGYAAVGEKERSTHRIKSPQPSVGRSG
jgi:hypothetical protein